MSAFVRALCLVLVAILAAACGGVATAPRAPDPLAGRYSLRGGGGALPVVTALVAAFTRAHPAISIVIEDVGSDAGVALAATGGSDLGMISRELKESEKGLVGLLPIGLSGTAVAVSSRNVVTDLAKDQVKAIYAGEVTDWSAVGGTPGKITVLLREPSAATRSTFEAFFFGGKPTYSTDAIEVFELQDTIRSIASFQGAIGMVIINPQTLGDASIRLLAIDGVRPTAAALLDGSYKIRRPLSLVYSNTSVKPAIEAFLDFVRGPEGRRIIAAL